MDRKLFDDMLQVVGGDTDLATLIYEAIEDALHRPWVHTAAHSVELAFEHAFATASRDLETHPDGQLFLRLVREASADNATRYPTYRSMTMARSPCADGQPARSITTSSW